jgi:pilus assembly protein CpaD
MHIDRTPLARRRPLAGFVIRALAAAGCAIAVCSCTTDQQIAGVPEAPPDYRQRHPITLQESDHTLELLIGTNRAELNPTQRAQVLSFGLNWKREATGGIIVARPVGSTNERAAADSVREILSILAASGAAPQNVAVRGYPAGGPAVAPVRISYPKMSAQAGPCGMWPQDIGPSANREYFENQQWWNFGCANQRNLAAMVDNPADLVQPRGESAAYTMRQTTVVEKYRQGVDPSTQPPASAQSAKISDVGK